MTASLHKLTAGSGYDYLTRQVAAMDSTEKGHATLTSYYSEKGETPGRWVGSGLTALDMAEGDPVDETQMKLLFGIGAHPNAEARLAALPAAATRGQIREAVRLGSPFHVHKDATSFQQQVAERCSAWAVEHGLGTEEEVPADVRATIRNDLATEAFQSRMGRRPSSLELSTEVAKLSRNPNTACAGFDVTFSPVKSVSTLWALAPKHVAAAIEECHNAAVADALAYIEREVLYSRRGAGGVRQVDVTGLIGTAFTHRDSRAGDPDLHTHVAIANKVQALDGHWLAIDGRPLYAGLVSVSEVYNTSLEAHLVERLGVRFAAEPNRDPGKRGVREIVGVPALLREAWSKRRTAIEIREADLAVRFQADHHRPPTPAEAIKLAQQATLATRDPKHEPRTIDEQRTAWRAEAERLFGSGVVDHMLESVQAAGQQPRPAATSDWVDLTAAEIVDTMGLHRASWTRWHLRAEASRRARERAVDPEHAAQLTAELLYTATELCMPVNTWTDPIAEPPELRRASGESMYSTVGTARYTSAAVIQAEQDIIAAAALTDGTRATKTDVTMALLASTAAGLNLNPGQINLVREMATSGRRVQLALAAAGSGKTSALAVLATAWSETGGDVVGLAPSAVAARRLEDEIGPATTLAKLVWDLDNRPDDARRLIRPGALVIVDEAGMADTPTLATVIRFALDRGASVRLVGDDQQLAAIGAGGVLRDIADRFGAVRLTEIMRFHDPSEAAASVALRDGRPEALGYYLDRDRLHAGTDDTTLDDALAAWIHDTAAGRDSLMLTGTRDQVAALNRRAREHRLLTTPDGAVGATVGLADGNLASVGDLIITRLNDRRLRVSDTDWVKNGDRWTVTSVSANGVVKATHTTSGLRVTLPAAYVAESVELGYAVTVHAAQGVTVDTTHTVLTGTETRQQMYVAMTRGRSENHAYVQVVGDTTEAAAIHPTTLRPATAVDILDGILARDGTQRSVTTETRESAEPYARLGTAVARYTDAVGFAIEHLNPDAARELDENADRIVDDLTSSPAWPTLRAHLLQGAASTTDGTTSIQLLRSVADTRELDTACDPAAVLAWRLPHPAGAGPLPWLPPIPPTIAAEATWGPFLNARAAQVREVADELRAATTERPDWALPGQPLTPALMADVEVWRAAWQIDRGDRRPTGPARPGPIATQHQRQLDDRLRVANPVDAWLPVLRGIREDLPRDPFAAVLAHHLTELHQAGAPVTAMLAEAVADGPLPAEQPAGALWWRLARDGATSAPAAASTTPLAPVDRWRPWAQAVNPELPASEDWNHVAGHLSFIAENGADLNRVAQHMTGRSVEDIARRISNIARSYLSTGYADLVASERTSGARTWDRRTPSNRPRAPGI